MNVLLLDDNLMSATRIENGLRAAKCQVVTVRRAPDANDDAGDFDLILFNLGSRSLDGVSQIAEWRARYAGVQIWAFCGHREVERWRAARAAGVEKILTNEVAMTEIGAHIA